MKHEPQFAHADEKEWDWKVSHPFIAATERDLVAPLCERENGLLLEIGCGQGGNLRHISSPTAVGFDPSLERLQFAKQKVPGAWFVCGVGEHIPFRSQAFQTVLIRDVLHHAEDPSKLLLETKRIVRSPGSVWVIEPNGRNPLMAVWALLALFDRRILQNSPASLRSLFARCGWAVEETTFLQALPVSRIFFHHRMGLPKLVPVLGVPVRMIEGLAALLLPKALWGYLRFRLR